MKRLRCRHHRGRRPVGARQAAGLHQLYSHGRGRCERGKEQVCGGSRGGHAAALGGCGGQVGHVGLDPPAQADGEACHGALGQRGQQLRQVRHAPRRSCRPLCLNGGGKEDVAGDSSPASQQRPRAAACPAHNTPRAGQSCRLVGSRRAHAVSTASLRFASQGARLHKGLGAAL